MSGSAAPSLTVIVKGYPRLSETFVAQELKALQDRGHTFDIWSLRQPYDDREHPIHAQITAGRRYLPEYLYQEPLRVARGLARAAHLGGFGRSLRTWLRDLARDPTPNRIRRFGQAAVLAAELPAETRLLYVHFLHTPGSVARYAAMMRGLPWGVSAHAKDIWTTPGWEKREKLADAAFGVTCTRSGAEHLRVLAPEPQRVALVYHGLDLSRFPAPPQNRSGETPFRLISVGRAVAKKGYDDLLDALTRLPPSLDWSLVHIGGGALSDQLKATASRLGLESRIEWRGKQDQKAVVAAMRAADLFVLPSKIADDGDRDGLPNVLMEAASQKLPILSTDVSAIPEFIEDGVTGTLVPPGTPAALAEAIATLALEVKGREAMAEAAYQNLLADFRMDAGIDRLDALIREASGAAPRAHPAPEQERDAG